MDEKVLLITDLDNTLWDWFAAWHASFGAMLDRLTELSGVPAAVLEPEIRKIHQQRGTSEYSNLLNEVPSLIQGMSGNKEPSTVYDDALHVLHSQRKKNTQLYPGVLETLTELRERSIKIVAYTESVAYWTEWRIRHTGLDGVIDVLYSAPDHELPQGLTFEAMRTADPSEYGLRRTEHHYVPKGAVKPNVAVLQSILLDCSTPAQNAVYVGDSLMKDISMAQQVGVTDVHAKYGEPQHLESYALLQRVSHWPDRDVLKEQQLRTAPAVHPAHVLDQGFWQLLEVFNNADTP